MYQVEIQFISNAMRACSRKFLITKAKEESQAIDKATQRLTNLKVAMKIMGGTVTQRTI